VQALWTHFIDYLCKPFRFGLCKKPRKLSIKNRNMLEKWKSRFGKLHRYNHECTNLCSENRSSDGTKRWDPPTRLRTRTWCPICVSLKSTARPRNPFSPVSAKHTKDFRCSVMQMWNFVSQIRGRTCMKSVMFWHHVCLECFGARAVVHNQCLRNPTLSTSYRMWAFENRVLVWTCKTARMRGRWSKVYNN
jgi:hypothetical protein